MLDTFRHMLEEMGALGVTDPVSGPSLVEIGPTKKKRAKAKKKAAAKPAKKAAKKMPAKKKAKKKKK